jgi:hypothetical protein
MVSCHQRNAALAIRFHRHSGARASANPESISPLLRLIEIPDRLAGPVFGPTKDRTRWLDVRNDE